MNVYETITHRIMEQLHTGTIPWHKPWKSSAGRPHNLLSQKAYRGINVWLLTMAGYSSPYWLSFRQAQEIGGHVKKGETGWPVVFWKWIEKGKSNQDEADGAATSKRVPVARLYTVFNVRQCELPARLRPFLQSDPEKTNAPQQIARCEQIITCSGPQ